MRQVRVVRVVDGDTVHVRDLDAPDSSPVEKIRMQGIDAPESKQTYGPESTAALNALLFPHMTVYLEAQKEPDKYGRTLGRLWAIYSDLGDIPSNRKDVNLQMVRGGHAWVYRKYPFPPEYAEAEEYAKAHASSPGGAPNLWANKDAQPPWEWRQQHKKSPRCVGCKRKKARYLIKHALGEPVPVCSPSCAQLKCIHT
jgi:micrococcal nuclease